MSAGIIGGLIGFAISLIAAAFLWHPKAKGQRIGLLGLIIVPSTVGPTIGGLIDSDRQMRESAISERDAKAREQSAERENLRQFGITRDQMTAAVRQIIIDFHKLPPGERRTRAIQSALLNYDRAASRLSPTSSTGVASLLPLAVEAAPPPALAIRENRPAEQPTRKASAPDGGSTATTASTVPAIVGSQTHPVVVTPVVIPPPPPPVIIPPPPAMMAPH